MASVASVPAIHSDELQSYMDSVDAYRTTMAAFASSEMKGEERCRAEEREKAFQEKKASASILKKNGVAIDIISKSLGLTPEQIDSL